ncbi:hypothetical protein KCU81_g93, partial [Aureobasidium melanogenum]
MVAHTGSSDWNIVQDRNHTSLKCSSLTTGVLSEGITLSDNGIDQAGFSAASFLNLHLHEEGHNTSLSASIDSTDACTHAFSSHSSCMSANSTMPEHVDTSNIRLSGHTLALVVISSLAISWHEDFFANWLISGMTAAFVAARHNLGQLHILRGDGTKIDSQSLDQYRGASQCMIACQEGRYEASTQDMSKKLNSFLIYACQRLLCEQSSEDATSLSCASRKCKRGSCTCRRVFARFELLSPTRLADTEAIELLGRVIEIGITIIALSHDLQKQTVKSGISLDDPFLSLSLEGFAYHDIYEFVKLVYRSRLFPGVVMVKVYYTMTFQLQDTGI